MMTTNTLIGSQCSSCGETFFPRRMACARCGVAALAEVELSGKGDIYSFTVIAQPPAGFEEAAPYIVAIVHLAEGPYVTARLADLDAPALFIGLPVEAIAGAGGRLFGQRRSLVE